MRLVLWPPTFPPPTSRCPGGVLPRYPHLHLRELPGRDRTIISIPLSCVKRLRVDYFNVDLFQTPHNPQARDPFYGHEKIARISARFITHLFACPENPPTSGVTAIHGKLPYFIAYALHRTKLHPAVTFAALVLLQRLKARFPTARGSSGHRLFISAFMIASKVICDDTYSNKSWAIVAQGMFSLREVNQMEREMCGYLDWEINVDNEILTNFENALRQDFSVDREHYPNYPNTMVSRRAARAAASTSNTPMPEPSSTTSPVPGFSTQRHSTPKTQSPRSQTRPPSSSSSPASYGSSDMPDTPPATYSNSSSPASSGSPRTPANDEMSNPQIKGLDPSPRFQLGQVPPVHPLKGQMFAFAIPSLW